MLGLTFEFVSTIKLNSLALCFDCKFCLIFFCMGLFCTCCVMGYLVKLFIASSFLVVSYV